jgi:hypothetical protein
MCGGEIVSCLFVQSRDKLHSYLKINLAGLIQGSSRGYECIARNQTWLYRLPQSQIIMYSLFIGVLLLDEKLKNF